MSDHISLKTDILSIGDLDPQKAHLVSLQGQEHLGDIFHMKLQIAIKDTDLDPYAILGKFFSLKLSSPNAAYFRYFTGHMVRLVKTNHILGEHIIYMIELVPSVWFLTQNQNYRIYQGKNIIDIINDVTQQFSQSGPEIYVKNLAKNPYEPFEYCVQHGESDWNFLSRLMEEMGIYYYFAHEEDRSELILCDAKNDHIHKAGFESHKIEMVHDRDVNHPSNANKIIDFYPCHSVTANEWSIIDYEFKDPKNLVKQTVKQGHHFGIHVKTNPMLPIFGAKDGRIDAANMAEWNIERDHNDSQLNYAKSSSMLIQVGFLFTYAQDDTEYLVTSMIHRIESPLKIDIDEDGEEKKPPTGYGNSFTCTISDQQFRPETKYDKPLIHGVQTAIVVGEQEGQDGHVNTDEYGRVKVKFHWDVNSKSKAKNTAWLRVMQPSAGLNYGQAILPRIGEEVVISFLNGDPDRPVIMGSLYNGQHKTEIYHTDMPEPIGYKKVNIADGQASKSWQIHKSIQGGNTDFTGDVYDLQKGSEKHTYYAQMDKHEIIKNDQKRFIGKDRHSQIMANDHAIIGMTKDMSVGTVYTIKAGTAYSLTAGDGGITHIASGPISETSSKSYSLNAPLYSMQIAGAATIIVGGIMTNQSQGGFIFESGGSVMRIGPEGITLSFGGNVILVNAMGVMINGAAAARIGDAIQISGTPGTIVTGAAKP